MKNQISPQLELFIDLNKTASVIQRSFSCRLNGISFTEFIILYYLNREDDKKLRRVDLADLVGLTASGITRLLLPMEKIGLVGRENDGRDARVKYVTLAQGGLSKFQDELSYINKAAISSYPEDKLILLKQFIDLLEEMKI